MKLALRVNEGATKARVVKDHLERPLVRQNRGSRTMPKTLQAVCRIDRLRVWQGGGVIELVHTILAQTKKAVALPEAFHQLTPDEKDAFYVFLFRC